MGIRTERREHNHIFQAGDNYPEYWHTGCPACALIRPEVMTKGAMPFLRGTLNIFGSPRNPGDPIHPDYEE